MKIVVAGGTGFIGQRLVEALRARGDDVVVLSRGGGAGRHGERSVRWDPAEPGGAWEAEVSGADAVVNLAGAGIADARWTAARMGLLTSSRVQSTERICDAIERAASKPKVLVNASAIGFYGLHDEGPTFDESSPAGTDFLGTLCLAWEAVARRAAKTGVRVALPRIGVVLAEDGGALAKMLPPFRAFAGGPIGSGKQVLSWISAEDCVRALVFAIDDARAEGPFNVCAPAPATMDEFARAIGRALGRPAKVRVPAFVLRAGLGEMASLVVQGQRVLPRQLVTWGFTFEHPTLDVALAAALRPSRAP
jgi:uncharacterized protein (TIGR01777 family)